MQIHHVRFCMLLDPSLTSAVLFPSAPPAPDHSLGEDGWPSSAPRHPGNRTLPVRVGLGWLVPVPFQLPSPVLSSVAHLLCSQGALKSCFASSLTLCPWKGSRPCSGVGSAVRCLPGCGPWAVALPPRWARAGSCSRGDMSWAAFRGALAVPEEMSL